MAGDVGVAGEDGTVAAELAGEDDRTHRVAGEDGTVAGDDDIA